MQSNEYYRTHRNHITYLYTIFPTIIPCSYHPQINQDHTHKLGRVHHTITLDITTWNYTTKSTKIRQIKLEECISEFITHMKASNLGLIITIITTRKTQ